MLKLNTNEHAFTGLEAAIVLVAFVVISAVFSYVVLGAGFTTTQVSQKAIHSGVAQAISNIVVEGNVYGLSSDNQSVEKVSCIISLASGGLPIDVTKISVTWSTSNASPYNLEYNGTSGGSWNITTSNMKSPPYLKAGEHAVILVYPRDSLHPRESFHVEIKPENGASLEVERKIPPGITPTVILN